MDDGQRLLMLGEMIGDAADLVGMPDVVLVRDEDDVARAFAERGREIPVEAEVLAVAREFDREGRGLGEFAHQPFGPVGRAIVVDDELIRQPRLRGNAVELLPDEPLAIIGRHGDGDLHCSQAPLIVRLPFRNRDLIGFADNLKNVVVVVIQRGRSAFSYLPSRSERRA